MHIVIVGPGALGCLLAALLHKGRKNSEPTVSLLDYDAQRAKLINSRGLIYEKDGQTQNFKVPASCQPKAIKGADVLLICVKSYDVEKTLRFCTPLIGPETLLVFMQNGIAHLQYRSSINHKPSAFATTTEGSTSLGQGHVRHAGAGTTFLGFLDAPNDRDSGRLTSLIDAFKRDGMQAQSTESIREKIWAKLFINIGINALTVIHNCTNGTLLGLPQAREQMRLAIEEAQKVADYEQIEVYRPLQNTEAVCRATSENISSMLQDVRRQRKTEIDAINGAIVDLARDRGIAVPQNISLIEQINTIERRYESDEN